MFSLFRCECEQSSEQLLILTVKMMVMAHKLGLLGAGWEGRDFRAVGQDRRAVRVVHAGVHGVEFADEFLPLEDGPNLPYGHLDHYPRLGIVGEILAAILPRGQGLPQGLGTHIERDIAHHAIVAQALQVKHVLGAENDHGFMRGLAAAIGASVRSADIVLGYVTDVVFLAVDADRVGPIGRQGNKLAGAGDARIRI